MSCSRSKGRKFRRAIQTDTIRRCRKYVTLLLFCYKLFFLYLSQNRAKSASSRFHSSGLTSQKIEKQSSKIAIVWQKKLKETSPNVGFLVCHENFRGVINNMIIGIDKGFIQIRIIGDWFVEVIWMVGLNLL